MLCDVLRHVAFCCDIIWCLTMWYDFECTKIKNVLTFKFFLYLSKKWLVEKYWIHVEHTLSYFFSRPVMSAATTCGCGGGSVGPNWHPDRVKLTILGDHAQRHHRPSRASGQKSQGPHPRGKSLALRTPVCRVLYKRRSCFQTIRRCPRDSLLQFSVCTRFSSSSQVE